MDSDLRLFYITPNDLAFYEQFLKRGLHQHVKKPNAFQFQNILNLCLTDDCDRVVQCKALALLPDCDHASAVVD